MSTEQNQPQVQGDEPADVGRRKALLGMGKFAGLAAPAVVSLLAVGQAEAWAGSGPVSRPPRGRRADRRVGRILRRLFG